MVFSAIRKVRSADIDSFTAQKKPKEMAGKLRSNALQQAFGLTADLVDDEDDDVFALPSMSLCSLPVSVRANIRQPPAKTRSMRRPVR